jgi:hypothetical protein
MHSSPLFIPVLSVTALSRKESAYSYFLLNDALLQAKKGTIQSDRFVLKSLLPLAGMFVEDLPDKPSEGLRNAFSLSYMNEAAQAQVNGRKEDA